MNTFLTSWEHLFCGQLPAGMLFVFDRYPEAPPKLVTFA